MSSEGEGLLDEGHTTAHRDEGEAQISRYDALTFAMIGASYLWPWNCLLSATPYFTDRFEGYKFLQDNYSSFVMSITTVTGTVFSMVLAERQNASYAFRVRFGEFVISAVFLLLAMSCAVSLPPILYFIFVQFLVLLSSLGTGLAQNGSYAIGNTLTSHHTQAITVGQAISGVVPPLISMASAYGSTGSEDGEFESESATGTALYFLTATAIGIAAYYLFHAGSAENTKFQTALSTATRESWSSSASKKRHIPLRVLLSKLLVPTSAVFVTFAISLAYPVFANVTESSSGLSRAIFIPLVYLFWNTGDLSGRLLCGHSRLLITDNRAMVCYAAARLLFIPAFFLCNIHGSGVIKSDTIYLLLHLAFGITNGHLVTSALIATPSYVEDDEKEAAGGFMTMGLSMGLATGSLLSFVLVWVLG